MHVAPSYLSPTTIWTWKERNSTNRLLLHDYEYLGSDRSNRNSSLAMSHNCSINMNNCALSNATIRHYVPNSRDKWSLCVVCDHILLFLVVCATTCTCSNSSATLFPQSSLINGFLLAYTHRTITTKTKKKAIE